MGPGSGGSPCLRRPSPVPTRFLPPARRRPDCPSGGGAAIDAAVSRSVGGAVTIHYTGTLIEGQSGSPVWIERNGVRNIVGIAISRGTFNRVYPLTWEMVTELNGWMLRAEKQPQRRSEGEAETEFAGDQSEGHPDHECHSEKRQASKDALFTTRYSPAQTAEAAANNGGGRVWQREHQGRIRKSGRVVPDRHRGKH